MAPFSSTDCVGLRMDRQTLDMEGARQGEISAASLQLGEDTIVIRRIATMSVERHEFSPWDTTANRRTQGIYASLCVLFLFSGLVSLGWWALRPGQGDGGLAFLAGLGLLFIGVLLGLRAALIALMLKRKEPYFRLLIGTSDGRQIPLVDNNRAMLLKIRDIVRHKLDTSDLAVLAEFDLNLDIFNVRKEGEPASGNRTPASSETRASPGEDLARLGY